MGCKQSVRTHQNSQREFHSQTRNRIAKSACQGWDVLTELEEGLGIQYARQHLDLILSLLLTVKLQRLFSPSSFLSGSSMMCAHHKEDNLSDNCRRFRTYGDKLDAINP